MPGHSRPPNHSPMETVISGVDLGILSIWFPASKAGRFCASVLSAPPPHMILPTLLCPSLPCGGCTTASAPEPTVEAGFICLVSFHTLTNKPISNLSSQDSVPTQLCQQYLLISSLIMGLSLPLRNVLLPSFQVPLLGCRDGSVVKTPSREAELGP